MSTTLGPTVLTIVSTGLSDCIPNFVLFWESSFVLLVLTVVEPELETAVFGSGLICLPDQFTLQSSHCVPNPCLVPEPSVQLS